MRNNDLARQARDEHKERKLKSNRPRSFFGISLCLSRACLGKMMHFIYKLRTWRERQRRPIELNRLACRRDVGRGKPIEGRGDHIRQQLHLRVDIAAERAVLNRLVRPFHRPVRLIRLRETPLFQASPWLSRACLGKQDGCCMNASQKGGFRTQLGSQCLAG